LPRGNVPQKEPDMSTSNPSRIFARLVRGKSYYLRDKA
jgi:hypothetical protein